jgi:hypothetical protein
VGGFHRYNADALSCPTPQDQSRHSIAKCSDAKNPEQVHPYNLLILLQEGTFFQDRAKLCRKHDKCPFGIHLLRANRDAERWPIGGRICSAALRHCEPSRIPVLV